MPEVTERNQMRGQSMLRGDFPQLVALIKHAYNP